MHSPLQEKILSFVALFDTSGLGEKIFDAPLDGQFSLHFDKDEADLYGMVDAVYTLYTIGLLEELTNKDSRAIWANRIIECQDDEGWFSKKNLRGHSKEHATAYSIGALGLLELESDEAYIAKIKPLKGIMPLLQSKDSMTYWIRRMGYEDIPGLLKKNVGWNHVWRSSHVGGGVAAAVQMTKDAPWWGECPVTPDQWLEWLIDWFDKEANPKTGYWQRALWNIFIKKPTIIDLGGAVHFYWVYDACKRALPYPDKIIESTIGLQKETGLYKDYPFCIDLDGNFSVLRAYLQLSEEQKAPYTEMVTKSLEDNFEAILKAFDNNALEDIYSNSHGIPGALVGMAECGKLPNFAHNDKMQGWKHVLDKVCWL